MKIKNILNVVVLLTITGMLFTSCVSGKKFKSSQARIGNMQKDSILTQNKLNECNTLVSNLKNDKSSLQNDNESLQNKNDIVQNDFDQLASSTGLTIAEQEERLKNLNNIIHVQKDVMGKLKNLISEALMKYKSDELYVFIKDGNVYVSLSENLLFQSGSDVVDPKGKEALKTLSQVLNNTKDIMVMIEGHTDNVPIKTKQFKDNWDLSTARATSIVRLLTTDFGFDLSRITASGRSQYHPVETNETIEGRARNRRTEIILSPNLKELYNLME